MELRHLALVLDGRLYLVEPSPDDGRVVGARVEEMAGCDEGGGGDEGVLVNDGLLHVTLDGAEHGGVDDAGEDADGVGPVSWHVGLTRGYTRMGIGGVTKGLTKGRVPVAWGRVPVAWGRECQ